MSDTDNSGRYRCDECDGEVVETAAGRECEDCHKRFPPLRTDGGSDRSKADCLDCGASVPDEIEARMPGHSVWRRHHVLHCPFCGARVGA